MGTDTTRLVQPIILPLAGVNRCTVCSMVLPGGWRVCECGFELVVPIVPSLPFPALDVQLAEAHRQRDRLAVRVMHLTEDMADCMTREVSQAKKMSEVQAEFTAFKQKFAELSDELNDELYDQLTDEVAPHALDCLRAVEEWLDA